MPLKGLVSLMDILRIEAGVLSKVMANVGGMTEAVKLGHVPAESSIDFMAANVSLIKGVCEKLDLRSSVAQLDRINRTVGEKQVGSIVHLVQMIAELQSRLVDELDAQAVFCVPSSQRSYYDTLQFSDATAKAFPSSIVDMEEAGKCYALGRNTACVYHLMKVTEAGLLAIAKRVNFPDSRPMWEPVLVYIDKQLRSNYTEMDSIFKGDVEFLSGISAQMHAVNLAWRRRVAHVESSYDDGQAKRIFDATRGLMDHIAMKLAEIA